MVDFLFREQDRGLLVIGEEFVLQMKMLAPALPGKCVGVKKVSREELEHSRENEEGKFQQFGREDFERLVFEPRKHCVHSFISHTLHLVEQPAFGDYDCEVTHWSEHDTQEESSCCEECKMEGVDESKHCVVEVFQLH